MVKILLADDEEAITAELAPFLERSGFEVAVARDGNEALNLPESSRPDLIVLDVIMPELNGREVCRQIRASGNWTPIIMLTQVGASGERAMSLEEGADDYLNKPFDPFELFPASIFVFRLQIATGTFAILLSSLWIMLVLLALLLTGRWKASIESALAIERLAQAEAHRRFVRRLNHELKNPLTAVRAGLANLGDGGVHEVSAQASLHNVRQQVERLGRLANDLRKLADLDTGEMEQVPVDLTEIVEEAVEMARSVPGREERLVRVNVQRLPWPLSPVQGDRDLLLLAVYNLLDNAL